MLHLAFSPCISVNELWHVCASVSWSATKKSKLRITVCLMRALKGLHLQKIKAATRKSVWPVFCPTWIQSCEGKKNKQQQFCTYSTRKLLEEIISRFQKLFQDFPKIGHVPPQLLFCLMKPFRIHKAEE